MGALKVIALIVTFLLFVLIVAGGLVYFLVKDVSKISLGDLEVDRVIDVDSNTFILEGRIPIENPSGLSIRINSIAYDMILKDSREIIASGEIQTFDLERRAVTEISFSQEILLNFTDEERREINKSEMVLAEIKGEASADVPLFGLRTLDFSQEIDIRPYIREIEVSL